MKIGLRLCALLITSLILPAHASGLRVTPLRLDVSSQQRSAELRLQNLTENGLPVEITVFSWRQENGQDIYEPTRDLFFAPPIIRIPPAGAQTVRFLLTGTLPEQSERSYRVYVEELPASSSQPRSSTMSFRMRFGIPLFVAAKQPSKPKLALNAVQHDNGQWQIPISNTGNGHLRVSQLLLLSDTTPPDGAPESALAEAAAADSGSHYLLPGSQQQWTLKLKEPAHARSVLLLTNHYDGDGLDGYIGEGRFWFPLP